MASLVMIRWTRLAGVGGALVWLSGCGGLEQADPTAGGGESASTSDDGTGPSAMTMNASTAAGPASDSTGDSATGNGESTVGVAPDTGEDTDTDAPSEDTTASTTMASDSDSTTTGTPTGGEASESTTGQMCQPSGAGSWGNCGVGEACGGETGACLVLPDGPSACTFECDTACDCPPSPQPASGSPAVVSCGSFDGLGGAAQGESGCYLSCQDSETCPDDMSCFAGLACLFNGEGDDAGPYEWCNVAADCAPGAFCIGANGINGCVVAECVSDSDCPQIVGGTATCDFGDGDKDPECYLDCEGDLQCPPGWACLFNYFCGQVDPG